jgi:cysteine synthase A
MGLKAFDEKITVGLADPHGAALYNYYAHGELKAEGFLGPKASARGASPPTSKARRSTPSSAFPTRKASIGSSACLPRKGCAWACRAGSTWRRVALAKIGPGARVATILCDTGFRYLSSLYNPVVAGQGAAGLPVA